VSDAEGSGRLLVFPDPAALARAAADDFLRRASDAVAARGRFTVALSGGTTPRRLYELLAGEPYRSRVPWEKTHFFWGDERHVPPDDPQSNYRMAREALLSRVPVPESNVHRIEAELADASEAAARYDGEVRRFFGLAPGRFPGFDLMYLGLGPEGHTASLFPGTTALDVQDRLVVATWVAKLNADRITMTYPVFRDARAVAFLVEGAAKAEILHAVRNPATAAEYPAGWIRPREGELLWFADRGAAGTGSAG
jgi:6-phosphogluconolactonase